MQLRVPATETANVRARPPHGDGAANDGPGRRPSGGDRAALSVFVVLLVLTVVLAVVSEVTFKRNEQRLLSLQTRLTGSLLTSAVSEVQTDVARVVGLAAEAQQPTKVFSEAMAGLMRPHGPFASATLAMVTKGKPTVLSHLGAPSIRGLGSAAVTRLFEKAARTPALVTTRAEKGALQRLGYVLSAPGRGGTLVVSVAQQLKAGQKVTVPKSSPDANLNFALYFGPTTSRAALIETNQSHLPLRGNVATAKIPFGDNVLTLEASSQGPLAGSLAQATPWGVLVAGTLISIGAAAVTERLVRRRSLAEQLAYLDRSAYQRQRDLSETLQRALVPARLPVLPGLDMGAWYLPSTYEADIGGDWYSVVVLDDRRCVFTVGDVSGHDMEAAGAMASMRYTMATMARLGLGPVQILTGADAEFDAGGPERFATALVGAIDLDRQTLTMASAGHVPPLVLGPRTAEFAALAPAAPLGLREGAPEALTMAFVPGSTVVAFTDGLVERRGETLDQGLGRLFAAASGPAGSADAVGRRILDALVGADHEDDIALVVIRFPPEDGGT